VAEGAHEALSLTVFEQQCRKPSRCGDRVGVGLQGPLEQRGRPRPTLAARPEARIAARSDEALGCVDEVARAEARLGGELGERRGGRDGALDVVERSREARDARRRRRRELVDPEGVAVPLEGLARELFAGGGIGLVVCRRLEQKAEPQLERQARVFVGREGDEDAERSEDALARARVALRRVRKIAPEERLERRRIAGVELQDLLVGAAGIARRELPLLEEGEVPERAQAGAGIPEL